MSALVRILGVLAGCVALAGCVGLAAIPPTALAGEDDNSAAAQACQQAGFINFVRADGGAFASVGDCVSYAAHGDVLAPVALNVSFVPDPNRPVGGVDFENVTVTGSGLEPGSTITYSFIPFGSNDRSPTIPLPISPNTVASDGTFTGGWQTGCPLDNSFVFYATTAYGQPITATGC